MMCTGCTLFCGPLALSSCLCGPSPPKEGKEREERATVAATWGPRGGVSVVMVAKQGRGAGLVGDGHTSGAFAQSLVLPSGRSLGWDPATTERVPGDCRRVQR